MFSHDSFNLSLKKEKKNICCENYLKTKKIWQIVEEGDTTMPNNTLGEVYTSAKSTAGHCTTNILQIRWYDDEFL